MRGSKIGVRRERWGRRWWAGSLETQILQAGWGGVFIIGGGGGGAGGGANPGLGPGAEPRGGAGGGWLGLTTLDLLSPATPAPWVTICRVAERTKKKTHYHSQDANTPLT